VAGTSPDDYGLQDQLLNRENLSSVGWRDPGASLHLSRVVARSATYTLVGPFHLFRPSLTATRRRTWNSLCARALDFVCGLLKSNARSLIIPIGMWIFGQETLGHFCPVAVRVAVEVHQSATRQFSSSRVIELVHGHCPKPSGGTAILTLTGTDELARCAFRVRGGHARCAPLSI